MKFNILRKSMNVVKNYEGVKAYRISPEMELYTAVVTAGLNDSFYESSDNRLDRIRKLMSGTDPAFVARLAVYARQQMYLRSIPMVLAVEMAKTNRGNDLVKKTVSGVVQRADEITELLAYYQMANGRTGPKKLNRLSKQVQKGLVVAFNKFDEYQFGKYNRDTEIKLRDALFLIHPKAKSEEQQAVFTKIATDTLSIPYTWETALSALGQVKFETSTQRSLAVAAKWEELIESGKLGFMALMRNLRNILEANVSPAHLKKVCSVLADADAVARSKQLPFRFLAAYREVKVLNSNFVTQVLTALEEAIAYSVQSLTGFDNDTRVLIACDVSGSMQKPISQKSKVLLYDIGLVLGMLIQSKCKRVVTGMFGDAWKIINMPSGNILANVDEYYRREGEVGYSTNGYKVIDDLIQRKVKMDKILIFTDCQMWNSSGNNLSIEASWLSYKEFAPEARLYLFDLAGYGQMPLQVEKNDVFLVAGWSDKVFEVLYAIECGESVVEKIKAIEI